MATYETDYHKSELLREALKQHMDDTLRVYILRSKRGATERVEIESCEDLGFDRQVYRRTNPYVSSLTMDQIVELATKQLRKFYADPKQVADAIERKLRKERHRASMKVADQIAKMDGVNDAYGRDDGVTVNVDGPVTPKQVEAFALLDGVQKINLGRAECDHGAITFADVDLLVETDKAIAVAGRIKDGGHNPVTVPGPKTGDQP